MNLNRYYPFKDLQHAKFMGPMPERRANALNNMRTALDMDEIFERTSIRNHGSYLIHGAIFKCTRDILRVGNPWAADISPLELQNADTKRTADSSGSRRTSTSSAGEVRKPLRDVGKEGPEQLVATKGYSTTVALSTLKHLLVTQYLRRGDGIVSTPESRRKERLFGEHGSGRTKLASAGVKCEVRGSNYDPKADTCLKAFVRLLAARSAAEHTAEDV